MAKETNHRALLPAGISDALPPDAGFEADVLARVMAVFAAHGYEHVKPPLIEFEETLTDGLGTAVTHQTFRLMDPDSQRMMGLRADMTPQIARIASSRMAKSPRPLRLSYAGQVVRVLGSQLRPERQFAQAGAELIGASEHAGDAEIVVMAVAALSALGIGDISVDLAMPTLVPAFCRSFSWTDGVDTDLRDAMNRKDAAAVAGLADRIGDAPAATLAKLIKAAGPADSTMKILEGMDMGTAAETERRILEQVVAAIAARAPELNITIDPVENRGFEYHSGVTYTFFARGVRGELGRGGRYLAGTADNGDEPATGVSLFMDTVQRAAEGTAPRHRAFAPFATDTDAARRLRDDGWVVVEGLATVADDETEARRMNCSHLLTPDGVRELEN